MTVHGAVTADRGDGRRAPRRLRDLDVARVRGLYLTVASGTAYLDGPMSALQPESVTRAIIAALRASPTQPGSSSERSQRSAASVTQARRAFADLVGGEADSVVLGASIAALQLQFTELVARGWQLGDHVVLSRLDSDAIATPWLRAARAAGVAVRWGEVDVETGELPAWQYDALLSPHTRLVSLPLANPATGTVPDVRAIADRAHEVGALVLVDVGAAATSLPVDMTELGADLVAVSSDGFGGPTLAALVARPGLLAELDRGGHPVAPSRLEFGPLPVELLGGATAAVDHLAGLDESARGPRRERLRASVAAAGAHTGALWRHFVSRVTALEHVTVVGGEAGRLPVFAFTVARRRPNQVGEVLRRRGVSVWTGPSGMTQLMTALGADELGGASFAGFMPYTTRAEVDVLLEALAALA